MTVYAALMGKGGVGKTVVASELVAHLARTGRKVLAIDLDQQAALTARVDLDEDKAGDLDAAHVILGEETLEDAAYPSALWPNVDIVQGTMSIADIDGDVEPEGLRAAIVAAGERWDDVVIDTMPVLTNGTTAAATAADRIIIPVTAKDEAMSQAAYVAQWLQARIQADANPDVTISAVVPMMYRYGRRYDEALATLRETFGPDVVTYPVPERVAVSDSFKARRPMSQYRPSSDVAMALKAAAVWATK